MSRRFCNVFWAALGAAAASHGAFCVAQVHQTAALTDLSTAPAPYRLAIEEYAFGEAALPTLHSFAAGKHDGMWVLIAGRTNGLHGFEQSGAANFPAAFQNRDVWVIDPVGRRSWRRALDDPSSGLSDEQIAALTPTNNQFTQVGERLYMTGGYGVNAAGAPGTFDVLSALDLPGLVDWVVDGTAQAADHVRQLSDPIASVTGGAMYEMNGKLHLVFGQDFQGGYNPNKNGTYTKEVRSFEIVDDGLSLAIENVSIQTGSDADETDAFRRRDLNVFPVLRSSGGTVEEGLVVLSGVFTTDFGAWTVPVEIDQHGNPEQADLGHDPLNADGALDADPAVFKQGFNGYHAAKLGLYSEALGEMHEVLFGGISLQYLDEATGEVITDDFLPFVNDITSVVIDSNGNYRQVHLGAFPEIFDGDQQRLRFGANAEFFPAADLPLYENGVAQFDLLGDQATLGYIFGGIVTNGPHTRGVEGVVSGASNRIFQVRLLRVPEPAAAAMVAIALALLLCKRKAAK